MNLNDRLQNLYRRRGELSTARDSIDAELELVVAEIASISRLLAELQARAARVPEVKGAGAASE